IRPWLAKAMRFAAGQIHQRDDGWTEEQWIDLIKVTTIALEDRSKGLTEIVGSAARYARPDRCQPLIRVADPQRHLTAIEDGSGRSANSDEVIGCHGWERRRAKAADNVLQVIAQLVQLMQRSFHRAGDDLNRSREAGRPRDQQGHLLKSHAALRRDFLTDFI